MWKKKNGFDRYITLRLVFRFQRSQKTIINKFFFFNTLYYNYYLSNNSISIKNNKNLIVKNLSTFLSSSLKLNSMYFYLSLWKKFVFFNFLSNIYLNFFLNKINSFNFIFWNKNKSNQSISQNSLRILKNKNLLNFNFKLI